MIINFIMNTPSKKRRVQPESPPSSPLSFTSSPEKEGNLSVEGFVHKVSNVKTSTNVKSGPGSPPRKTMHFNFTLQTSRTEYHEAVHFAIDNRTSLLLLATSQTPVKLTNVAKTASKYIVYVHNAPTIFFHGGGG